MDDPEPGSLAPDTVEPEPIAQFRRWFDAAVAAGVRQPEAMTLATVDRDGTADARTVLLRGLDERGFAFYTNLESTKSVQMRDEKRVALVFHWREVERQVRVRGPVTMLERAEASAYWEHRPRGHRISAWASPQSEVVDPATLASRVADVEARFTGGDPPLPPFWGGYVVGVRELECWQGRTDRLHERVRYRSVADRWIRERLAP